MGNLQNGEVEFTDLAFTSDEADIDKYSLLSGELLFNRTNSPEWVGKTAIYRGEVPAIFAGYIIRVAPILIDSSFLNYMMNSEHHRNMCLQVKTDGVNQSNINAQKLSNFVYPLPPLPEQRRIVTAIDTAFAVIDEIERNKSDLQATITAVKKKILSLAIQGKLVPQNPADEPASVLLERIKAMRGKGASAAARSDDSSHYPKVPEGWVAVRIQDVCRIYPRNDVQDAEVVSFVPMTLIDDGFSNHFTYQKRTWGEVKSGFTHFQEGDVGLAKITPCLENRKSVIFCGLINGTGAGTTELHIFFFFFNSVVPKYLLWFF
jgi:type I restriction enzyme S subunit